MVKAPVLEPREVVGMLNDLASRKSDKEVPTSSSDILMDAPRRCPFTVEEIYPRYFSDR